MNLSVLKVNDNVYHIRDGEKSTSMLTRYGILKEDGINTENSEIAIEGGSRVSFSAGREVIFEITQYGKCYMITVPMSEGERIFGLGDSNRERLMIRGMQITLHKENVRCYGPMPILLSSDGWALLVNTTYTSVFDIGNKNKDEIAVQIYGGMIDFYLFRSESLLGLTKEITKVTGRPMILPKYAYGFTVVNNEKIDAINLLEFTRLYREKGLPCDCMGLEPSWMNTYYDFSVDKKWDPEKFYIPYWQPINTSSHGTFFHPLRRMGMQLSLWLCEDYDLLYHEEKIKETKKKEKEGFPEGTEILDSHLASAATYQDKITKPEERWFEHLKKFVDNGASAFKLDASNQVLEHPDRLWGGKFSDAEVHNVYPVLLAKEMANGYREYTDRRLMINTSCAYLGTQQFAATWAGDTGGGPKTLVSVMNYAMCGHSNSGCDIDITNLQTMHYGFLMPWSQQNNWASWNYPWYMGDDVFKNYAFYANLRSSLFPYLYYAAYEASSDGVPMLRPLPLIYGKTDRFDNAVNAYMLGDSLYVGAFNMNLSLPEGEWVDYFTGEIYEGGRDIKYVPPKNIGGALFVKNGAVIVTMTPQKYILEKAHEYIINLYPAAEGGKTAIYEDDGFTYDYEQGGFALTEVISSGIENSVLTLSVKQRKGSFNGRPDNGHNIISNSIPEISSIGEIMDIKVVVHGMKPKKITLEGKSVPFNAAGDKFEFIVESEAHKSGDLDFIIEF